MLALSAPSQVPAAQTVTRGMLDRFLAYLDASPATVRTYTKTIRIFGTWLSERGIAAPVREDLIEYRNELAATRRATTVRLYMAAVKMFFRWTALEGLYPNVADHIKSGRVDHSPKKDALTSRQARQVLAAAREDRSEAGLRNYAILVLLLTAGLRSVEVVRLDVGDLGSQGDVAGFWVQGKGHASKDTFCSLAAPAEDAIREYLAARARTGRTPLDAPLFASTANRNRGGRLTTTSVSSMVKAAFRAVGLDSERLTCHSTRHSAITLALLNGASIQEVAQFARHSSIATTQIYAHNLDRLRNRCGSTIASVLF